MSKDIVELLNGSYRNPKDGVVVVSPRLLVKAAKEIETLRQKSGYQYDPADLPEVVPGDARELHDGAACRSVQSGSWYMEWVSPAWDEDGDSDLEQVDKTILSWIAYRNWLAENPADKAPQEDQHE